MKIIVSGGASGLGAAITRSLAAASHEVLFTYCNSADKARAIEKEFPHARGLKCDFTADADLDGLIREVEDFAPDVLVNNAVSGKVPTEYFHKSEVSLFENGFRSNILPVVRLTQSCLLQFRKRKSGRIITILSAYLAGKPPLGLSAYVAEKNYLLSMSKSWAVENARYNIVSNAVSPSFMHTPLNAEVDERVVETMVSNHPLKKLLTPEEVADTVLWLTTASNHINGINLVMNAAENVI